MESNFNIFNINIKSEEYLNKTYEVFNSILETHGNALLLQNADPAAANGSRSLVRLRTKFFTDIVYSNEKNIAVATALFNGNRIAFLSCSTPEEGREEHFQKIAAKVAELSDVDAIIVGTDLNFPHDESEESFAQIILTSAGLKELESDALQEHTTRKRGSVFTKVSEPISYFNRLFTRATAVWFHTILTYDRCPDALTKITSGLSEGVYKIPLDSDIRELAEKAQLPGSTTVTAWRSEHTGATLLALQTAALARWAFEFLRSATFV